MRGQNLDIGKSTLSSLPSLIPIEALENNVRTHHEVGSWVAIQELKITPKILYSMMATSHRLEWGRDMEALICARALLFSIPH